MKARKHLFKRQLSTLSDKFKNTFHWCKWQEKCPTLYRLAQGFRRTFLPPAINLPNDIYIEVTNACNLHCKMCPQHSRDPGIAINRKTGFMDINLCKKIIDEVSQYGDTLVSLIGAGEPLLYPGLVQMVRYAKMGGNKTHIITNGQLLTSEMSEKLIDAGLDMIGISVDGVTKLVHEKIRKGSNFNKVVNNVEELLKLKNQRRSALPLVRIMIVEMEENKHEVDAVIDRWLPLVDEILISTHRINYGRKLFNCPISIPRVSCFRLWRMIVISWDGKVALCCDDWGGEVILGDTRTSSIRDIWFSKRFQKIRRYHLMGEYYKIPICANCDSWMSEFTFVKEEADRRVIESPYSRVYTKMDRTQVRKSISGS